MIDERVQQGHSPKAINASNHSGTTNADGKRGLDRDHPPLGNGLSRTRTVREERKGDGSATAVFAGNMFVTRPLIPDAVPVNAGSDPVLRANTRRWRTRSGPRSSHEQHASSPTAPLASAERAHPSTSSTVRAKPHACYVSYNNYYSGYCK